MTAPSAPLTIASLDVPVADLAALHAYPGQRLV